MRLGVTTVGGALVAQAFDLYTFLLKYFISIVTSRVRSYKYNVTYEMLHMSIKFIIFYVNIICFI